MFEATSMRDSIGELTDKLFDNHFLLHDGSKFVGLNLQVILCSRISYFPRLRAEPLAVVIEKYVGEPSMWQSIAWEFNALVDRYSNAGMMVRARREF